LSPQLKIRFTFGFLFRPLTVEWHTNPNPDRSQTHSLMPKDVIISLWLRNLFVFALIVTVQLTFWIVPKML